jgi:thioredoxin 1
MSQRAYRVVVLSVVAVVALAGVAWKLQAKSVAEAHGSFPAVLDFGMGVCEQCKKMKPILTELADEYDGRCRIEIVDIGKHPEEADRYSIKLIPTQIFFDAQGREIARHEGFMPKADIVARLREMGVR